MAEQYIYSRSDRGFTNARGQAVSLGFGFVALSPGMDTALTKTVETYCAECPRLPQRDGQGTLPFLRKVCLPKGRVLLQKSTWIEDSGRDFHVAHGYVFENEEAVGSGPASWFTAAFQLGNPNAVEDGILLDSVKEFKGQGPFALYDLKDAAGSWGMGLDKQQFCQLLLACFDALASRRQVLIAMDLAKPEMQRLRDSILYWIYTCLPYDLWGDLGFDSVYTERSVPGLVHIAFVDRASVQSDAQQSSIQLGAQTLPLGGNFLVLDGQLIHNDSKYETAWYGKSGAYVHWLEQIVDTLWDAEERRNPIILALNRAHRTFHLKLSSAPEEERRDLQQYNTVWERIPLSALYVQKAQ